MLRRSLVVCARSHSGGSSDAMKKGKVALHRVFGWYPVKGGEFLGNLLAGHNLFIQDIPKRFDKKHARHFSLVEALTIVPLFSLSIVHYFSVFCQYPSRARLAPAMMTELGRKTVLQNEWMQVLQQQSHVDALAWRATVLATQLVLFPLSLLVSAMAPQLVHATLQHTNHILATKYECIGDRAPPFVSANVAPCQSAEDFHKAQLASPTDFGAAVAVLAIVFYLTS